MGFLTKYFNQIAFILFGIILFIPLLSLPPWFSPPAWGQTIIFRILISVFLILLALRVAFKKTTFPLSFSLLKNHPVFLPATLLVGFFSTLGITTIFSLDRYFSFWNTPTWSWGFINLLFYVIFAASLFFLFKTQERWNKLWLLAFGSGTLISLLALAQQFGIQFIETFVTHESRPVGTLGSSTFLGIYLTLLVLPLLGLAFLEKEKIKKRILFSIAALFVFTLVITLNRAAFIGLGAGLFFFLFFYPKNLSYSNILRKTAIGLSAFAILTVGLVNIVPQPEFIRSMKPVEQLWSRLLIENIVSQEPRIPGWQAEFQAFLDRPILGYGPYNASIGFDKYYTTEIVSATGWWSSAHNMFLDILLDTGIVGFLFFVGFLATLIWKLQKAKLRSVQKTLTIHAAQAALIGYCAVAFFSFNTFATYLMFFFLIAYSFFLITQENKTLLKENHRQISFGKTAPVLGILATGAMFIFIWNANIQPLAINKDVNWAVHFAQTNQCQKAFETIQKTEKTSSYLDYYVRNRYFDIINECILKLSKEQQLQASKKAVSLLKENTQVRPFFTRTWIALGGYTNNILAQTENPEQKQELAKSALDSLQKAQNLSPNRPEVFPEQVRTYMLLEDFAKAYQVATACIETNPTQGICYWQRAQSSLQMGNIDESAKDLERAAQKQFFQSDDELLTLINAYDTLINEYGGSHDYYEEIAFYYKALTARNPKDFQYFASLAFAYREIEEFGKARKAAEKVLELNPDLKETVDAFLQTLPPLTFVEKKSLLNRKIQEDPTNYSYHLDYAQLLIEQKDYLSAKEEAQKALDLNPEAKEEVNALLQTIPPFTLEQKIYEASKHLQADRTNPQRYIELAQLYKEAGDASNATWWALRALELDHSIQNQVEQFINSLPPLTAEQQKYLNAKMKELNLP